VAQAHAIRRTTRHQSDLAAQASSRDIYHSFLRTRAPRQQRLLVSSTRSFDTY
jgi:hypothetical protein